jgi:hypothetical protein
VWKDVESSTNLSNLWGKGDVLENFKEWFVRRDLKQFKVIPYLVLWKIWTARNESIFEDRDVPSFQVASQALSLLPFFKIPSKFHQ